MTKNGGDDDAETPIEFRPNRFGGGAIPSDPMEELAHFSLGGLRAPFAFDPASNGIIFKRDQKTVLHLNLATNNISRLQLSDPAFQIFSVTSVPEHGLVVCLNNAGLLYIATATVSKDLFVLDSPKFSGIKCSVHPENGDTVGLFSMAVTPDKHLLQVLSLENTFSKQMPSQYLIEVRESGSTENVEYHKQFYSFSHHIFQISRDNKYIRKSFAGIGKILTTQTFELKAEKYPPETENLMLVQCDEESLIGIFSSDGNHPDAGLAQLWQLDWSSRTWHHIAQELQHPHWPVAHASIRIHASEVFVVGDCGAKECSTRSHLFKLRLRQHKNLAHLSSIPEERFSELLNAAASSSSSHGSVDDSDFDDVLACSVCQTLFENPKQLICGHSFCEKCCQKMASEMSVVCPLCRSETPIAGALPTNYILKQVVGKFKRQRIRMSRLIPCTLCAESLHNERIFACKQCHEENMIENAICARCGLTKHAGHNVVSLEILSHLDKENLTYSLSSLANNCPNNTEAVDSISASLKHIQEQLGTTLRLSTEHSANLQATIDKTTNLPFINKDYSTTVLESVRQSGQTLKEINAALELQAKNLRKCEEILDKFA